MNEKSECPIWGTPASEESADGRDGSLMNSPRAGGRYFISEAAIVRLSQTDKRGKARLTTWLVDQRRLGVECPEIFKKTVTMAEKQKDLSKHDRADRLLQYIGDQIGEIGKHFDFFPYDIPNTEIAAWSESVGAHEVRYLLDYLDEKGWVKSNKDYFFSYRYIVTVKGYDRLEELETANTKSSKGFREDDSSTEISISQNPTSSEHRRNVFIIHGRDEGTKEAVARFIKQLGLNPIILHEQPNQGQTIIEKFERHAEVAFAIALLTPDDTGGLSGEEQSLKPRARQNVIFELGYFTGKLDRGRVCALKGENVEIPSDYDGVLYIPLDESGGWKMTLMRELKSAGFEVDVDRVLE